MSLLERAQTTLLLVDVQERLAPAMHNAEGLLERTRSLLKIAGVLNLPVVITEQYPRGLGHTLTSLRDLVPEAPVFAKTAFGAMTDEAVAHHFHQIPGRQLVIAGIEAHVCVLQTAIQALEAGFQVHIVGDAVSSRRAEDCRLALQRMQQAGAVITAVESVGFECLRVAGTEDFKAVSRIIR